uniref:nitroreductase family protein n=1 Tax=Alistipes sp. TaxID=1872444 RepID=UPI004055EB3F
MKKIAFALAATLLVVACAAGDNLRKLPAPNKERTGELMQALSDRQSIREYSDKAISEADLSDLLWAANGVNRPDGKRTAPSAVNRQDIKIYLLDAEGAWLYDHTEHALVHVGDGDYRQPVRDNQAPINLVLVADEEWQWSGVDAGYVSQNIYLFCAANGMATVAMGMFDRDVVTDACGLNAQQEVILVHPVGYQK